MTENNTRVPLREHIDAKFDAQEKLTNARFDAMEQKQDAHAVLEAERWKAHGEVHKRERRLGTLLLGLGTAVTTLVGSWFPRP